MSKGDRQARRRNETGGEREWERPSLVRALRGGGKGERRGQREEEVERREM